ncbi:MAG: hypothetical protein MJ233_04910 [Mycoplasmoidaceae bacterium]|nr:hypothetical protein [Mycoplasmoidaceae bacterium]
MKISKFLNIFIPILSATTIVAVPSTLAGIEAHNFVPAPVPPGPTPPEPTKDIVLNELSFITDDGENVLPFIQSEEMSIYANKEYEIKISMSV